MLQFYGDFFVEKMGQFNAFEAKLGLEPRENKVIQSGALSLYAQLGVFAGLCQMHGLTSPAQQCQRIMLDLEAKHMVITCGEMRDNLRELRRRCEDDFKTAFFLHLDPQQAKVYENPLQDWESVSSRFQKIRPNLEECSKCLALERYQAAVFHVLQVAEYGVIQVAVLMGVQGDKPGWGNLKKLAGILDNPYPQRSPLEQKHSKFLESVVPLAIIVRDNWRHKLDHVGNQIVWVESDFSAKVAEEIISATRAFMRKLASDLPH
jgi:hypothetical protein